MTQAQTSPDTQAETTAADQIEDLSIDPVSIDDLLLAYFEEHFEAATGIALPNHEGPGDIPAPDGIDLVGGTLTSMKSEKLLWATNKFIADLRTATTSDEDKKNDLKQFTQKQIDFTRKEIVYTQVIRDKMKAGLNKLGQIDGDDPGDVALGLFRSLLDAGQVTTRIFTLLANERAEKMGKKIKDLYADGGALKNDHVNLTFTDADGNVHDLKDALTKETNPKKIRDAHEKAMAANREALETEIAVLKDASRQIDLQDTLDLAAAEKKVKDLGVEANIADLYRLDAQQKFEEEQDPDKKAELKKKFEAEKQKVAELKAKKATAETELSDLKTLTADEAKLRKQEIEAREKVFRDVDTESKKFDTDPEYKADFDGIAKKAELGFSLIGLASTTTNLIKTAGSDDATGLDVAAAGTFAFAEAMNSLSAALEFGKSGDVKAAFGSGFAVAGAAASFAGAAINIHALRTQLDDPNITDQQAKMIKAEIGMQSIASTAELIAGGLSAAAAYLGPASKVAAFAGTAVPVLGAVAVVASSISPATWQGFRDTDRYADQLKDSSEEFHSAALLGELLEKQNTAEKGFYGAGVALDAAVAAGGVALAASGVGAPAAIALAAAGAGISAIMGAIKQGVLDKMAADIAKKMRVDENGNEQTIEEFFQNSFDLQQEQTLERYQEMFDEILTTDQADLIVTAGSQTLNDIDLTLGGMTRTADEMGNTAEHYFQQYAGNEDWQDIELEVVENGEDVVRLPDIGGKKVHLAFTSPLLGSGEEEQSTSGGKKTEYVHLDIKDLAGWVIEDTGTNATSFDVSRAINEATDLDGNKTTLDMTIKAGGGDDTYFAHGAEVTFHGGEGSDTASFVKLDTRTKSDGTETGIHAKATASGFKVDKILPKGSEEYVEVEKLHTSSSGKKKTKVEYRTVEARERKADEAVTDTLTSVEIIQGSAGDDTIDAAHSATLTQMHGFDGDDMMTGGAATRIVTGGLGHDTIDVSEGIRAFYEQETIADDEFMYIDAGRGADVMVLDQAMQQQLADSHANRFKEAQLADYVATAITGGADDGAMQESLRAQFIGQSDPLGRVFQKDIEHVAFDIDSGEASAPDFALLHGATRGVYGNSHATSTHGMEVTATGFGANWYGKTSGGLSEDTLIHFQGKIYLEEGKTYEFREITDDYGMIHIGGERLLFNNHHKTHETETYTATETGLVDIELYARNAKGSGTYAFQVTDTPGANYQTLTVANGDQTAQALVQSAQHKDYDYTVGTLHNATEKTFYTKDHSYSDMINVAKSEGGEHHGTVASNALSSNHMAYIKGQMYLEGGETYYFKEYVDDNAIVRINGKKILQDSVHDKHTTGSYTPSESGFVDIEFYALNRKKAGNYEFAISESPNGGFRTIQTENAADKLAKQLDEMTDSGTPLFALLHDAERVVEKLTTTNPDALIAATAGAYTDFDGAISGGLSEHTLVNYAGQLYLEAGKTYEVREISDDIAIVHINGTKLIVNAKHNQHEVATYTATETGFVAVEFLAKNNKGPGSYKFQIREEGEGGFQTIRSAEAHETRFVEAMDAVRDDGQSLTDRETLRHVDDPDTVTFVNVTQAIYEDVAGTSIQALKDAVAQDGQVFEGALQGTMDKNTLVYTKGQMYLEAGESVTLRETVYNDALILVDGEVVLHDTKALTTTEVTYTATETGFVDIEFFAKSRFGDGEYRFQIKQPGDAAFKVIQAENPLANDLAFHTVALKGISSDEAEVDNTHFAADYNAIINDTLFDQAELGYATRNSMKITKKINGDLDPDADLSWQDMTIGGYSSDISGTHIGKDNYIEFRGEIYLEAGVEYSFRETGQQFGQFMLDGGENILATPGTAHSTVVEGSLVVEDTGFYGYRFVSKAIDTTKDTARDFGLEIKVGPDGDYQFFNAQTVVAAALKPDDPDGTTPLNLIGDDLGEQLMGAASDDFIFGDLGRDQIGGGDGHDLLMGGEGADTFIWNAATETGHNNVIEAFEEDWAFNTFQIDADISHLQFFKAADDLIVKVATSHDTSMTLHRYFDLTTEAAKVQRFRDSDGDTFLFDGTGAKVLSHAHDTFEANYASAEAAEQRGFAQDRVDSMAGFVDGSDTEQTLTDLETTLINAIDTGEFI